MKMTTNIANGLMDHLFCVAVSASGGLPRNSDGSIDYKLLSKADKYAKMKFVEILEEWESIFDEKWEFED